MNNFAKRLENRIADDEELKAFYEKLVRHNFYLELENNIETRLLVTALQAQMGALIGEALTIENVYPSLIMHTTLPSTPLCIIGNEREELLNQILAEDLLQNKKLKNSVIMRSFAIEAFLNAGRTFVALYIKEYHKAIIDNIKRLQDKYPNLILKKVEELPSNLHGSTYLINDARNEKSELFFASVITTQCGQSLKDSLELTKIFIKSSSNYQDDDFYRRLFALYCLLQKHNINCNELVNLDPDKFLNHESYFLQNTNQHKLSL